jgi:hypothetical protein
MTAHAVEHESGSARGRQGGATGLLGEVEFTWCPLAVLQAIVFRPSAGKPAAIVRPTFGVRAMSDTCFRIRAISIIFWDTLQARCWPGCYFTVDAWRRFDDEDQAVGVPAGIAFGTRELRCSRMTANSRGECSEARRGVDVSVIVPVRRINEYAREGLRHVDALRGIDLEWICLPDVTDPVTDGVSGSSDRIRVVATGQVGPARKRDIAAAVARGRILAFLDDDAYPSSDWLQSALPHFDDDVVAAVGGPGVTPAGDGFWKQASGWALASRLGSGAARNRYLPVGGVRDVDDWPSMNLLVRASDFSAVGGFDCDYFPGEDTKLCLALVHRLGKRIVYEPRAIVYHHRRDLFWGHFRQVGRYGEIRGHFARRHPETSRRPIYFAPMLIGALVMVYPAFALFSPRLAKAICGAISAYIALLFATVVEVSRASGSARIGVVAAVGVAMTHFWYGAKFALGLVRPPAGMA